MSGEVRVGFGPTRNADGTPMDPETAVAIRHAIDEARAPRYRVAVAVFCEQAIQGQDGLYSLIRIFDHLYLDVAGEQVFPITVPLRMHLSFRQESGPMFDFIGVRQINPDESEDIVHSTRIAFGHDGTAADAEVTGLFTFPQEGRYLFDILDGHLAWLTRVPLRVTGVPRSPSQADVRASASATEQSESQTTSERAPTPE